MRTDSVTGARMVTTPQASRRGPIRLGGLHLVYAGSVVLVVVPLIAFFILKDSLYAEYVLKVKAPQLQQQFGFQMDRIKIGSPGDGYKISAISAVTPGGLFAKAGFRPGDVPTGYVHGLTVFYSDLEAVRRGYRVTFRVTTVDELNADTRKERQIFFTGERPSVGEP